MSRIKIYGVFDEKDNGKMVFQGTRQDVTKWLGFEEHSIYNIVRRKTSVFGRYRVKVLQEMTRRAYLESLKPKPVKLSKHDEDMNHLLMFLKMHGNVASDFDPNPYLEELSELGFECRVRKIIQRDMGRVSGQHRKEDIWYVTEKVNGA